MYMVVSAAFNLFVLVSIGVRAEAPCPRLLLVTVASSFMLFSAQQGTPPSGFTRKYHYAWSTGMFTYLHGSPQMGSTRGLPPDDGTITPRANASMIH